MTKHLLDFAGCWRQRAIGRALLALIAMSFLAVLVVAGPTTKANTPSETEPHAADLPLPTVSDITAFLRTQKPENAARKRKLTVQADRQPPKDVDRTTLARFYMKRGLAARKIVRVAQTIKDLTLAYELGADLSVKEKTTILYYLGALEVTSGNRIRGIRSVDAAIAISNSPAFRVRRGAYLALVVSYDDFDEANRRLGTAEALMHRIRDASDPDSVREWRNDGLRMEARVLKAKGRLSFIGGQYSKAEMHQRNGISKLEEGLHKVVANSGAGELRRRIRVIAGFRNELVLALYAQGRLLEAEIEIRETLRDLIKVTSPDDTIVVRSIFNLSEVLLARGRPRDAETLARAALQIQRRMGVADGSNRLTLTRVRLARALLVQNRWQEAVQQFDLIKSAIRDDPDLLDRRIHKNTDYALALLKGGNAETASAVARRAVEYKKNRLGNSPAIARGIHAMALSAMGKDGAALAEFRRAAPVLLVDAAGLRLSRAARDRKVRLIFESYMELLARIRGSALASASGIDPVAEAFRLAEAARGQAVQRALNAAAARFAAGDSELAGLARREQDLSNQIGALQRLYARTLSRSAEKGQSLSVKIAELRARHAKLRREIGRRFPSYATLMNPKPPTLDEARANLRPKESLIATYVGEKETHVWAVPHTGPVQFASMPIGAAKIGKLVERIRRGITPTSDTLGGIPAFDVAAAHQLYKTLLEPVAAGWEGAKHLLVAAHGPLGQVPFAVLAKANADVSDGSGPLFAGYRRALWLARTHDVTSLPTVSALVALRATPDAGSGRRSFAGFADPWFSPSQADKPAAPVKPPEEMLLASRGMPLRLRAASGPDGAGERTLAALPRLPDTAAEVQSIAAALKADLERDVFTGPRASERRVKTMDLDRYKVIAFASHALLPGELNGLTQPAIALTAPAVAGDGDDGLLTMTEILGLELNADWVVLSACNTASGDGQGAEAVSGLGRAFLYAGARALLVTHWRVESESARGLVTDLFRRQAKDSRMSRSEALRQAKLALMDGPGFMDETGRTVFSYAHPLFWAPFSLFGEGRS